MHFGNTTVSANIITINKKYSNISKIWKFHQCQINKHVILLFDFSCYISNYARDKSGVFPFVDLEFRFSTC